MATRPDGADVTGQIPARQPALGLALIGLGVATALAVFLLMPSVDDSNELAGLSMLIWFVIVVAPGWVTAGFDLAAGIGQVQGRPWGRPMGIIAASATIAGAGLCVLIAAQSSWLEGSGERDRTMTLFAVLSGMATVALGMQLVRPKRR